VTGGTLDSIVLSPASAWNIIGRTTSYTALARDQYGNSLGNVSLSTSFSIAPDGHCSDNRCSGSAGGPHTVTGTYQGKTASAALSVDFVRNSEFGDLNGWNSSGSGAGITLTHVLDDPLATGVAKLTNTGGSPATAALQDSPNWVTSTLSTTYTGSIWVRADTPGAKVKLRFREYSGSTLVGTLIVEATLTTAWQQVTINYPVSSPGTTLDFHTYVSNAAPGTVFYADNASIVHGV
jgi:hypothetical protein